MKNLLIGACLMLCAAGCVPVFIGAGVVAGYSLTNDSASGEVTTDYRTLWDSATDVLQDMHAEIAYSNESKGVIKALSGDHKLTLHIDTLTGEKQKLTVSARKYLLPKPQFAQKVFFQIIEGL